MNPFEIALRALMSSAAPGENSGILDMSLKNLGKNIMKKPKSEDEDELSSFLSKARASEYNGTFDGAKNQYSPSRLYGGIYGALGGQRVRGGLLGD